MEPVPLGAQAIEHHYTRAGLELSSLFYHYILEPILGFKFEHNMLRKYNVAMLIFIDESGNFREFVPNVNNFGERFVTLAAVIFEDNEYKKFKTKIKTLTRKYHEYLGGREIKSHSIRRSNPQNIDTTDKDIYDFYRFGSEGQSKYCSFCDELKKIVVNSDFKVISVSTDKVIAQTFYPHLGVLTTLLGDLWERIFICHYLNKVKKSRIFFDPQLKLNNRIIKDSYQDFVKSGSWFVGKEDIGKVNLYKNVFSPKSEDSVGIQLADYCAYPIKRCVEGGSYDFFDEVVKPKLHPNAKDTKRRRFIIMGLKVSLNRQ